VNILGKIILASAAAFAVAGGAHAADMPTQKPAPAPPPAPASCTSPMDFITTDCPLTWYGITFYGTVDMGVGWESHGTPFNPSIISGVEEFVQKNSNHAQWLATPGGLAQSFVGVKGKEDLAPGWSFVFDLSMGFDPYSLTFADGPRSFLENNGVPLASQTSNADSSRAGQFYNGAGYAGISNTTFGTLTFGRQNSFTLDGVIAYDPMGASYAFSPIGWSGLTAGAGDTEDARETTSVKYRIDTGMFRVGGLYQFGGYQLNNGTQNAFEAEIGADINLNAYGKLSLDAIYSRDNGAVSSASLATAALAAKYPGTIAATISDDASLMLLAKYTYNQVKVFGGFENITFMNPHDPQLTSFTDISGIPVNAANIVNTAYTNHRIMQIMWTGGRYAFTDAFDVGAAYYHYNQMSYNVVNCNSQAISAKCAGTMDAVSFDADWRFAKKFDVYAGVMFSQVDGGLANGYLYRNNLSPTAGLRFRF
jgi:predicted porin